MAAGFPLQSNASCRALAISSLFQRILTGRKVLLAPGLDQYVAHEIVFPSCMAVRRSASTAARCLCHQAAAYFVNTAGENGERGRRELRLPGGHDDGARCSNGGRRLGRRTSLRRVSIHVDDPEHELQLNARDKGKLDHGILERLYKTLTDDDYARASAAFQFMPHMPGLLHAPLGQEGIPADLEAPLECAAKVECSCCKCLLPQDGHSISGTSDVRRTSFSNLVPQSWQRYS